MSEKKGKTEIIGIKIKAVATRRLLYGFLHTIKVVNPRVGKHLRCVSSRVRLLNYMYSRK